MTAITAVLSEFGEAVIHRVTDPRTGIVRTLKWMPSVAEVVEACDAAAKKIVVDRLVTKMLAYGFRWDGVGGWVNAHGETYFDLIDQNRIPLMRDLPDEPDQEWVARIALPPPPKGPEVGRERVDELLGQLRTKMAEPEKPVRPDDGRHGERVAADIAARLARRKAQEGE